MAYSVLVFLFVIVISAVAQCKILKLSCEQIRCMVDGHNSRRLRVAHDDVPGQPAATDMKTMVWDDELATKAADWADKGVDGHNPDRDVESGRFQTGENIYWYSTTASNYDLDVDQAIEDWFNEYKDYEFGPISADDFLDHDHQIGHYTQLVWSNSVYVGCGVSRTRVASWTKFKVVCNYGPFGNVIGQEPYQTDGPAQDDLSCGTDDCSNLYGDQC